MRKLACFVAAGLLLALVALPARAGPAYGTYRWPVRGPVIRGFEQPTSPYTAGHRGIDIAVPFGTPIHAPADGTVAFAGWVAGFQFVSIDHPDGVRSTYSWLSRIDVHRGDRLVRGAVFALTGHGHPDVATPHLHFGAKVGSTYIDPMLLLEGGDLSGVIHLAPLASSGSSPGIAWPTWTTPWRGFVPGPGGPHGPPTMGARSRGCATCSTFESRSGDPRVSRGDGASPEQWRRWRPPGPGWRFSPG